jgi:hypothetical protein
MMPAGGATSAGFGGVVRRGRWLLATPLLLAAGTAAGALWKARDVGPSRLWLAVTVIGLGLGTGLLLAAIRESLDSSIHTDTQAEDLLGLPVLAAVPWIPSLAERRARLRRGAATVLGAVAVVIAAATVSFTWLG